MNSPRSTVDSPQQALNKKTVLTVFVSFLLWTMVYGLWTTPVFAEMSFEDAEDKAAEAHKLAASDVIYQEQDWKALYFQNVQIISLLKDIKQEMEKFNARETTKEEK